MRRESRGVLWGVLVTVFALTVAIVATPDSFFATTSVGPLTTISYSCGPTTGLCQYNADTASFVGMNNPYNTFNSSASLGSYIGAQNFIMGAGTISANSAQQWKADENVNNASLSIASFPAGGIFGYTGVIDDYTSLSSGYSSSMPINSTTQGWATTDDWLQPAGQYLQNFSGYEIQIHMDTTLVTGQVGCEQPTSGPPHYGNNFVMVANNLSFDGALWYLCDGQFTHNSDGSCPANGSGGVYCGELVFVRSTTGTIGGEYSSTSTSGTLDLFDGSNSSFFYWLEHNNVGCQLTVTGLACQTFPYMQTGVSLYALTSGWEIATTSGNPETFTHSAWTIAASGAPTPPSTTATFVSFSPGAGHTCVLTFTGDSNATSGYDVSYFGAQNGTVHLSSGATSYTFTGTGSGQTFNAAMQSVNTGGTGPYTSAGWSPQFKSCTTT